MKKKLLACSLLVIGLSTAAYGTVAYFTHEDTATNVITAGDIQIALQEWTVPEEGGEPVPFEDEIDVLPGAKVSKIVEVKNIGGQTAYIRVAVDKEIRLDRLHRGFGKHAGSKRPRNHQHQRQLVLRFGQHDRLL